MACVELRDLNLVFPVVHDKGLTFKEFIISRFRRRIKRRIEKIHALKDVSLSMGDGARVGIVGHNGAGKSTLLRAIAGVYPLDSGDRRVEGRICSLFDLTLGFEREGTGWDNIRYRAYLQGETPETLREKLEGIAQFTELGDFLDVPLKCYSAGMVMRLAFAIATANAPEILLIDEVFGTGDLGFRAKAQERMAQMMDTAKIIVMVGHDLAAIESFSETVIWMDHGRVKMIGPAREVLAAYQSNAHQYPSAELVARYQGPGDANMYMGRILSVGHQVMGQILKNRNGRWMVLASMPVARSAGRLRFDVMANTLHLYLDNQLITECYDGELVTGSVGLRSHVPGASFERFSARAVGRERRIHPLAGNLVHGEWKEQLGGFERDGDRWFTRNQTISLATLDEPTPGDVSVSCDVDLKGSADLINQAA